MAPYPLTPEHLKESFAPPPPGVGNANKLTIMSVDTAVGGLKPRDLKILALNKGAQEFAVAALLLWRHIVPDEVRLWLEHTPIDLIPLSQWSTADFKSFLDSSRFSAHAGGEHGDVAYLYLRKIGNLSGRNLDEADWEKEMGRITDPTIYHSVPTTKTTKSTGQWLINVYNAIDQLAALIVHDAALSSAPRTLRQWWEERSLWMPSGSSSERHRLDKEKESCDLLASADRPNKKGVAQTIPFEELLQHLTGPAYAIARCSTKHEPGFKNRALYAADDWSTYIASYASADLEKVMNIGGMVAKQTPADVVDWMRVQELAPPGSEEALWLSLDYTDFNKEHANCVMRYLNLAFAKAWATAPVSPIIAFQKAYASLWVAQSHMSAWAHVPTYGLTRSWHGLWSGHRNTARDNTILHKAYSMVVQGSMRKFSRIRHTFRYLGICGDDEDGLHQDWIEMVTYLLWHFEHGHALNPRKQQVGYAYHEFLQRQSLPNQLPSRPLCATLATVASGNWYKEAGRHFDSAIRSHSDYGWELICRGAAPIPVQRLIGAYLDVYMTAMTPKGRVKLEWWDYRNANELHPLWSNGVPPASNPQVQQPELPKTQYPLLSNEASLGTNDLFTQRFAWLQHLSEEDKAAWHREQQREAHKAFFGRYSERQRHASAAINWPLRKNFGWRSQLIPAMPTFPSRREAIQLINPDGGERAPPTLNAALAAINLDTHAFRLLGGWKGVAKHGSPADMRVYQNEWQLETHLLPQWLHCADPALASWAKSRNN